MHSTICFSALMYSIIDLLSSRSLRSILLCTHVLFNSHPLLLPVLIDLLIRCSSFCYPHIFFQNYLLFADFLPFLLIDTLLFSKSPAFCSLAHYPSSAHSSLVYAFTDSCTLSSISCRASCFSPFI